MEKISLIAWRCREKRFPETEAQRRARQRAQLETGDQSPRQGATWHATSLPLSLAPLEFADEEWFGTAASVELPRPDQLFDGIRAACQQCPDVDLSIPLTSEQSQALRAHPLLEDLEGQHASPPLFTLTESQDPRGIILHFSLHREVVPEMMSLKDVCRQLRVGRRAIVRLIRTGELRCYRVGNRYRFAVAEVRRYLDQAVSQQTLWEE